MKKAFWAGCVVVVGAAGFAGGTVFTGKLVSTEFERYVAAVTENYQGVANVSSTVSESLWGSQNTLSIEFLDLSKSVTDWAGTNTIDFDIAYTHSFLSSRSVLTLSDTQLLQKLKSIQVNSQKAPLIVSSDYQYDFGEGQVSVSGDIELDALRFGEDDKLAQVGASKGEYKLTQGAIDLEWKVAPSTIESGEAKVDIGEITLKESAQVETGDVLTALVTQRSFGEFAVDSVKFTAENAQLLLKSMVMSLKQHIEGERVVLDVDYQAAFLEIDDKRNKVKLEQPQLQLLLDLDLASVVLFVEKLQQLQMQTGDALQHSDQIVSQLSLIADQGVNADLKRLSVSVDGETLLADAKLELSKVSATASTKNPIDRMDLEAALSVPKKFLEAMPNYNPAQIRMLTGFGVLVDAGDSYKLEVTVKDAKALLNGQPMPGI